MRESPRSEGASVTKGPRESIDCRVRAAFRLRFLARGKALSGTIRIIRAGGCRDAPREGNHTCSRVGVRAGKRAGRWRLHKAGSSGRLRSEELQVPHWRDTGGVASAL